MPTTTAAPADTESLKLPQRPLKVIMIGSSNCGKTSLRHRLIHRSFSRAYRASVGADFETVSITSKSGQPVQLSVWDTAGQERFKALSAPFYRGSDAVLLCYSATDTASLQALRTWYDEFVERCPVAEEERWRFCFVGVRLKDDWSSSDRDGPSEEDAIKLFDELLPPLQRSVGRTVHEANSDAQHEQRSRTPDRRTIQVSHAGMTTTRSKQSMRTNAGQSIYHTPDSSLSNASTIKAPVSRQSTGSTSDGYDPLVASSPPALPPDFPEPHYEPPSSSLLTPPEPPKLPREPIPNGHIHPVAPAPSSSQEMTIGEARDYGDDGIKHFTTSAKDDRGVHEVFEYVVERVMWKWAMLKDEERENEQVRREREDAIRLGNGSSRDDGQRKHFRCC